MYYYCCMVWNGIFVALVFYISVILKKAMPRSVKVFIGKQYSAYVNPYLFFLKLNI